MPIIATESLTPHSLPYEVQHQVYCGLDTCVTLEVFHALRELRPKAPTIYSFERALQGPYLEIMQRGFAVDQLARASAARSLRERIDALQVMLDEFAMAAWGRPLNPNSPAQLKDFFYSKMRLPEVWLSQKGERKLSCNREALEKLETYLYARPFVSIILLIRDLKKQLDVFDTEIDPDGRYRTSYNIAGTETGRPSSSSNAFGTGGNAQNIAAGLRYVFVADQGWKLGVIDLEQVEARDVGFFCGCLFNDWSFLNACESGDLHTNNCRLIWPEMAWTGDLKKDRVLANQNFYREFSYRDMSKRGGHLCLTEDHEVLTPEGWESIKNKPTQILTWQQGKSEFQEVPHWVDEIYTGDLITYEGNSLSACMTTNHRIPYIKDQKSKKLYVGKAGEGIRGYIPLGQNWIGGNELVPARLIAAFMSDGHQKSTNRMEFHFAKSRKIKRLVELCKMYGFEFEVKPQSDYRTKVYVHGSLPKKAGAFMFNWTKTSLAEFVDEYKHWDGHIAATSVFLCSTDYKQMEWLQTFGRISGVGGNISSRIGLGNARLYRLQQNNRRYATTSAINKSLKTVEQSRVLCPTVPAEFFYIRRKGCISVTGNTNYFGTDWTMSRHLKIPLKLATDFQLRYARGPSPAYPAISTYWGWIAQRLQTDHKLTTPFGRERHFFGRSGDDTTLREGIAFLPQSTTADRMNLGLWRVWKYMPQVQLLAQTYDSITFQYRETANEADILTEALQRIRVELVAPSGRRYVVPGEAKVGWNWAARHDPSKSPGKGNRYNPDGLVKWTLTKPDLRRRGQSTLVQAGK